MIKTKDIQSVTIVDQAYEAASWDGLSLVTIETTESVYTFPNVAISYSLYSNFTIVEVSQLIGMGDDKSMTSVSVASVSLGESLEDAIASILLDCVFADYVCRSKSDGKTQTEREAERLVPVYLAFGDVVSTEAGKTLFALAYDAGISWDSARDRSRASESKRPTKRHQRDTNDEAYYRAQRLAYVDALTMMVCEAAGFKAPKRACRRVVNSELEAFMNRTPAQTSAASITALYSEKLF